MTRGGRPGGFAAALLFTLLGFLVATTAAAQAVGVAIDACVRKLDADTDVGYERVAARCPGLARQLEGSELGVWLPRDWQRPGNDLSAGGLRQLREWVGRELRPREKAGESGVRAPLSVDAVAGVLARLGRGDGERSGWWGQAKEWLREIFGRRESSEGEGWLGRVIGEDGVSQAVLEWVSYGALALVVVVAVGIVGNELRVGGVWGRVRRRFGGRRGIEAVARREGNVWKDVHGAPLAERPRLLLEVIAARLREAGCLPAARGLTVQELVRVARLGDERDRERLVVLAGVAERVRFSGVGVGDEAIGVAVEGGVVLLGRITAGGVPGQAPSGVPGGMPSGAAGRASGGRSGGVPGGGL